jgi:hypothetical protein
MSKRNVYHINEVRKQQFYQVPKQLLLNTYYRELSNDAKLLYSILQDRMELSRENGWVNDDGEIYLIFTRKNARDILNISSKSTITKIFNELKEKELIYEERQGLNKPNIIYIGKIDYLKGKNLDMSGKYKKCTSGSTENGLQEVQKVYASNTELNDTDFSNKEHKGNRTKSTISWWTFKLNNDPEPFEEIIYNAINYYMEVFEDTFNEKHPNLKPETWINVINSLRMIEDKSYDRHESDISLDNYKAIIDQHFNTPYQNGCDYNIPHFVQNDILRNRYFEVGGNF